MPWVAGGSFHKARVLGKLPVVASHFPALAKDTNCFLTHSELSLLCGRLWRWTPVVEAGDLHGFRPR